MDNAKDFCYNLALTSSTDEKSEDEDEAFVDDIRWDFFWRIKYFFRKMVFVFKIVLTYCEKKLFYLVIEKKLLKFEAEGLEFAKILRSLEQFIQTVKGQNNFW